mgnify:CR=1 FL=1
MKKSFLFAAAMLATSVVAMADPVAAPAAPVYPANQVKAVYSATYNADCNFGEWGSGVTCTDTEFGKKYVMSNTYFGLEFREHLNCAKMEALHLDFFSDEDMDVRVVPIHGAAEVGVTKQIKGGEWNAIDIKLSEFVGVTNWADVYQIKLDNITGKTFWLNNVYFYTTQAPDKDEEAPKDVKVIATEPSYFSAKLTASATDNSDEVIFDVMDGETVVATLASVSAKETSIVITNLKANTEYNYSLVVRDPSNNKAETVAVSFKTLEAPEAAPVPAWKAEDVKSIYCDAYETATAITTLNASWWKAPQMAEGELAEGNKALYYYGFTDGIIGWEYTPFDATGYTTFSFDIYPLADGTIDGGPLCQGGTNGGDYAVANLSVKGNQWNTITIDLKENDLTNMFQVKWINYYSLKSFFIDNVYFYKEVKAGLQDAAVAGAVEKAIVNGQLVIVRNGVRYNAVGQVVE